MRLKRSRLGVEDFEPLKVIGRGAFGEGMTLNLGFKMDNKIVLSSISPFGAEEGHGTRLCHENT